MLYILCFQFLLQKISYVVNRNKVMDVQDAAINCCEETKHELQCCGYVLRKGKELVFYVQQNTSITCHHFAAIVNFILYLQHFMLCSHALDFFFSGLFYICNDVICVCIISCLIPFCNTLDIFIVVV